jgi:hypothetical protein
MRIFDESCRTACLALTECSSVPSCAVCEQAGLACVVELFSGRGSQSYHCVSTPPDCDGSCACMNVCNETLAVCSEQTAPESLQCYVDCPTC